MSEVKDMCPKCGAEVNARATYNGVAEFNCGSIEEVVLGKPRFHQTPHCKKDAHIAELEAALKEAENLIVDFYNFAPASKMETPLMQRARKFITDLRFRALASTEKGEG